jgi:hypothetical protein
MEPRRMVTLEQTQSPANNHLRWIIGGPAAVLARRARRGARVSGGRDEDVAKNTGRLIHTGQIVLTTTQFG